MSTTVNLKELIVDRPTAPRKHRIPWLTRYILPGGLIAGFAAVAAWSLRDSLVSSIPVTVVPVLTTTSTSVAADTPLFRAAGWIEPRPTPVFVSALNEGIVDRLLVVEGQEVEAGKPVALLVRRDAEIAVEQAQADVSLQQANLESAAAHRDAARIYWREPVERQAALAEAQAILAKVETELSRVPAAIRSAEAKLVQARKELDVKTRSQDAVAGISVDRARVDVEVATALIEELQAQRKALLNEVTALKNRRDVLSRQLELKVEEERKLKDADAQHQAATARLKQVQAALDSAQLRLERTVVKAPITGKVLALVAKPGSRLMGIDRAALMDASTVISMYDPHQLQVRADVRLENVPQVLIGQPVHIETPAVPQMFRGRVLAMTSSTDIQKNTLQVKVAIDNPPAVLKPDMLVEATFLAVALPQKGTLASQRLRLMIPAELVDRSAEQTTVWVADAAARVARHKTVQLGSPLPDGMIEVTSGLSVGDRLIAGGRESMVPNCRIIVRGEAQAPAAGTSSGHEHGPKKPQRLY
ncbi:MAG: efflux transporter, family, subunit [Planctomycetaceae bacterium]|nr:efflux transporter, family, subunit [Planctomycetaceae bacterium]